MNANRRLTRTILLLLTAVMFSSCIVPPGCGPRYYGPRWGGVHFHHHRCR